MFLFGAAALLLASDTSRTMIESVFAELTVFFATNTRLCITAFVVVASLMALRWLRGASKILNNTNTLITRDAVSSEYSFYEEQFKDPKAVGKRQENYKNMVNFFYDLVTDFYEWGWGKSFHFAPRFKGESFRESILRAEHFLGCRLHLTNGHKVADIGCGVGGPAINIARFSGCSVVGVNNNDYQIRVATRDVQAAGLADRISFQKADFMHLPFEAGTFDGAYAIEATCHAPDKVGVFSEVLRALKPGARFAVYEWCVTDKFDAKNPRHVAIKEGIEVGNGLPELARTEEVVEAMRKAGFNVLEARDVHDSMTSPHEVPWYKPLEGGEMSLRGFLSTKLGGMFTHMLVNVLETLRIAPKGTAKVSTLLRKTQVDLIDSGKLGIFTPGFFVMAEKPMEAGRR